MQFFRETSQFFDAVLFPAQLNEIGPAFEQFSGDGLGSRGRDIPEIEDGVKLGTVERIHRAQSVSRPFDGRNSKVSEFMIRSTNPVS